LIFYAGVALASGMITDFIIKALRVEKAAENEEEQKKSKKIKKKKTFSMRFHSHSV
jgi:hypothetical protein